MTEAEQPGESRDRYESLVGRLGYSLQDEVAPFHRNNPRFGFDTPEKTVLIQIGELQCALHDVSLGGLSFYAPRDLGVDTQLTLDFDGRFQVGVRIVHVILDEGNSTPERKLFLHGSEFKSEMDSYKCTLLVLGYLAEIMQD